MYFLVSLHHGYRQSGSVLVLVSLVAGSSIHGRELWAYHLKKIDYYEYPRWFVLVSHLVCLRCAACCHHVELLD